MRFQVLFHSPNRGSFHLSLTVLVHYRSLQSTQAQRVVPQNSNKISRVPFYSRVLISITFTGLSPSMVSFSKLFKLSYYYCWPSPLSLATTYGVSIDFFSSGYLDVSVLQVVSLSLFIQLKVPHKVVGFPIRKFSDQSLHTTPRNLSQYTTSFFVFQCQGIRHTPLNA